MKHSSVTNIRDITQESQPIEKNATRLALIKAAMKIFGRDGYAAASTRAIADEAKVNQALINYHFSTKQGLYLAVFKYISTFIQAGAGEKLAEIETALNAQKNQSREFYWQSITQLMNGMLHMINSDETTEWSNLIIREQQRPTEAFSILENGAHGHLRKVLTRLVAGIFAIEAESEKAKLTAITLMGQILMFKVARATVLTGMQWEAIEESELMKIKRVIFSNYASILGCEDLLGDTV